MKELKDSERNLINEGLVMVDYSAEWCGGCQVIKPIVEKLATEYEGKVNIYGCDVDECAELTSEFGIRNIPTLLFFKNGVLQNRLVGSHPEKTIRENLDLLISESGNE